MGGSGPGFGETRLSFKVWGSGCGVGSLGFVVWDLMFGDGVLGCGVWDPGVVGCGIRGLGGAHPPARACAARPLPQPPNASLTTKEAAPPSLPEANPEGNMVRS